AVRVDEIDLPVRVELPGDRRRGSAGDPVQDSGRAARLRERDGIRLTDRERVPVKDSTVRGLGDRLRVADRRADRDAARRDLTAAREDALRDGWTVPAADRGRRANPQRKPAQHGGGAIGKTS